MVPFGSCGKISKSSTHDLQELLYHPLPPKNPELQILKEHNTMEIVYLNISPCSKLFQAFNQLL